MSSPSRLAGFAVGFAIGMALLMALDRYDWYRDNAIFWKGYDIGYRQSSMERGQ